MPEPDFLIGNVPVHGSLILAPMDGITDPPFRALARKLGSALSISEFINCVEFLTHKDKHAQRYTFEFFERPIGIQLLDNDPYRMAESACRLDDLVHPDFFDVNLGCCVRRVTSRGAGAGLMRTPQVIESIFMALQHAVSQPLTAKMRLGWDDDHLNYIEIGELCQDCGAKAIALHGRTAKMAYNGKARWHPIAELKATLSIPVIGNGDVLTPLDAIRMMEETSCDAVMIGRGALTNPWIFSNRERMEISPEEVEELMLAHLDAMIASYPTGAIQAFRKFIKPLLVPYDLSRESLQELLTCKDPDVFKIRLISVFNGIKQKIDISS